MRFSYILHDFLIDFGIWFWVVENLGSSHHVSVVRVLENNRQGNEKKRKSENFRQPCCTYYIGPSNYLENNGK